MIVRGEWGPVRVLSGRYKGQVGYYDDDEGRHCVVYLGVPFARPAVLFKPSQLEPLAAKSLELERWKRTFPELAAHLGIP